MAVNIVPLGPPPISITGSATAVLVELTIVLAPKTVRLPLIIVLPNTFKSWLIVAVLLTNSCPLIVAVV